MDAPPPLDEYLAAVRAARPADYPAVAPAEFERMRDRVLRFYDGVRPVGTHRDSDGLVVDCVPYEQHPVVRAARAAGHDVGRASPRPTGFAAADTGPPSAAAALPASPCPRGTLALARLTLDELARHGTLDRFDAPPGEYSGGVSGSLRESSGVEE